MRALKTSELNHIRNTAQAILTDYCTIQTATETDDDMGGFETSYSNAYTDVPCKLETGASGSPRANEGDRFTVADGWVLRLKHTQAIESGNRVVIGSETYEVISVEDAHTWVTVKRAMLKRISFDG